MTVSDARVATDFAGRYRFPFDEFQLDAMECVGGGESVMVAAPTSAGKTVVAEYALWKCLGRRERAFYTTPIKALSNQKRQELETLFPGRVGLLTGDRSENRDADVVVMTTEVLRNMLLEDQDSVASVGCVVFDEVHYLADPDRGTIWEESIIACPKQIQLICLSATVANAEEIAEWISQTHRPIMLIRHDQRPVPLEHYAFTGGALRLIRDAQGKRVGSMPHNERRQHRGHGRRSREAFVEPEEVVLALKRADLLPAIWFAFTRRGVELDAERCAGALPQLSGPKLGLVEIAIDELIDQLPEEDRALGQIQRLVEMLRHGVGFHHAGIVPPCKELVENLFTRGLLGVVCATDTLSVGINMPARTVVISSMSRPVAGLLTPNDFSQLTGRAGRRGIDKKGAVVLLPTPFHDFERSYASITGPLEPVRSAFTLRYSTLLAVFTGAEPERRLATLVASSLRQFQLFGDNRDLERELTRANQALRDLNTSQPLNVPLDELEAYLAIQSRLTETEKGRHGGRSGKLDRSGGRRRRSGKRSPDLESARSSDLPREIQSLRALLRSHPLHQRALDPQFLSTNSRRIELLRRRSRLLRTLEGARREQERNAEALARGAVSILRQLGYVSGKSLTAKALGLKEIVAPSGIVISEMYHDGALDGLAPAELAEVISWFASDADRRRYNTFRLPHHLWTVRTMADTVFRRISGLEEREGIRLAQGPSSWFWGAALAWCTGHSVAAITPSIELADGDVVSVLNKTVDLADQLKGLLTTYGDFRLLGTLSRARALLSRGLVAMIRTEGEQAEEESTLQSLH